jgi:uncharacterized SAM-binding protein YcdF (DUF218 family)
VSTRRAWWVWTLVLVVAVLGIAILARDSILTSAGRNLWRSDTPSPGTTTGIVLMGDNSLSRAKKILELYQQGTIDRIMLMREKEILFPGTPSAMAPADIYRDYFYAQGVEVDDVVFLPRCETTSTYDEATCIASYLARSSQAPSRLVIVTTWTHTARAGWIFERVMPGNKIEMVAAPLDEVTPDNWWRHETGVLSVFNEYLKWTFWRVRGVSSWGTPAL